ncbi:unnamed protein product [marine sediment metagenome]|uniref:Uncharacterized protein n=1 Tax=marine sediment metagenome TaxID=412755 RepID=X1QZV2_9ZZZZ
MEDQFVNWRNHRWYFDADYVEREVAPILANLIAKHGSMVDDTYAYIFQGKAKQYIIRFPHWGGTRWNPRVPTERPKKTDPAQKKLEAEMKSG